MSEKNNTDIKNMIAEMEYGRDESVEASKDSLIRMDKEILMYKVKLKHKNDKEELQKIKQLKKEKKDEN